MLYEYNLKYGGYFLIVLIRLYINNHFEQSYRFLQTKLFCRLHTVLFLQPWGFISCAQMLSGGSDANQMYDKIP